MMVSLDALIGFAIEATDGEIGKVEQAFFDDERWVVRYLVVRSGSWLVGKKVLISPLAVKEIRWGDDAIAVTLTKEQVEQSPDIDTEKPVSRQMERRYFDYYRWPYYWTGAGIWGTAAFPTLPVEPIAADPRWGDTHAPGSSRQRNDKRPNQKHLNEVDAPMKLQDAHIRSSKEVLGYQIEAEDGSFGHLRDFFMDEGSWELRYLVINPKRILPGHSVLLPVDLVQSVSWGEQKVKVQASSNKIKQSPSLTSDFTVERAFEKQVHKYYGINNYWERSDDSEQSRKIG